MSNSIKIRKGLDLRLVGDVSGNDVVCAGAANRYAVFPEDYYGIVPKLAKKEGDTVCAGERVLYDKNNENIAIVSPVAGTVARVVRGERRKILRVEIEADHSDGHSMFDAGADASADEIRLTLQRSGLWAFMRQRPYDVVPDAGKAAVPRDIFVTAFDSAPLASAYTLLNNNTSFFEKGIAVLAKLTPGKVYVCCREDSVVETPHSETFVVKGPHPAGNAGVQIANIKPVNKCEIVWTLDADTVVRIGHLFTKGYVDFSCIVAVTGECVKSPVLLKAVAGMPFEALLKDNLTECVDKCRIISGNVLTGMKESIDGYLHFPFRQVTVIPENSRESEFMGWASLSLKKYSFSHCFFSWLEGKNKKYHFDARINGSERAIIMAGEYDKVFPMDIYSEYLIKAILAKDIDKMEQLGIYEVAPEDFALCEFIDTSKLELQKIVREGLDYLRKEMN